MVQAFVVILGDDLSFKSYSNIRPTFQSGDVVSFGNGKAAVVLGTGCKLHVQFDLVSQLFC